MLLTGNCILNNSSKQKEIFPYIHNFNNKKQVEDIFISSLVPDVNLEQQMQNSKGNFSLASGEFIEVYSNSLSTFHSVVTCFFIDTSHFILDYIDTIYDILKPGGFWLNLGPLTFHYSGSNSEASVELSWNEILEFIKQAGFIVQATDFLDTTYCQEPNSMRLSAFHSGFFSVRKPEDVQPESI